LLGDAPPPTPVLFAILTSFAAEKALKLEQAKPQYSISLLNIVASEPLPIKTRLAAALAFKNFIRTNYVVGPDRSNGCWYVV
jgi:hypothetical protein